MEQIICKNLSFSYPLSKDKALDGINLSVKKGELIVVCGRSGCGKTTLLRHFKKALTPAGTRSGEVLFNGVSLDELAAERAAGIGFVAQDPDSQIVTDKVWHELAFGLENLGTPDDEIRLRTAEMASYFGIQHWFDKKTDELSGGNKQLLNLASVMVMNPELIIFDEPTSQLDPVAASRFLSTVAKINRDLGVTVIMTEHRLEEAFGYANRVIVMDSGKIAVDCGSAELSARLGKLDDFTRLAMPSYVKLHSALGGDGKSPQSIGEGAAWLNSLFERRKIEFKRIETQSFPESETAAELKNIFFRYEKNGEDVLKNLNLKIPKGSIFAVMGGNGAGKSTLIKVLSSSVKPLSGKIKIAGGKAEKSSLRIAALPQSVQTLFTKKTVRGELEEMGADSARVDEIARLTEITALMGRHPYDISGGEQQRTALAKLLLKDPDILLLDEPTKGMDCEFKLAFADILRALRSAGKTTVIVSHDIEFCASCADFCAMIFDGSAVCVKDANSFFAGNYFYTTSANKMSRGVFENCVTDKEVIALCRKNL